MADKKYDTETFFREAISVFRSKLNAKIAQINTEKGDATLETVNDSAWFVSLIPENFTFSPFILVGLMEQVPTDFINQSTLSKITLQIEIGLSDKNWQDVEAFYRLLRYQRALSEVAYENSQNFGNGRQPIIEKLPPALIKFPGNSIQFSGINITVIQD